MEEIMAKSSHDMTKGNILIHIIRYAIPMILGNYLQLTYNLADSVIISKFLGENSLAACSASNPVMTLMILGASGLGMGASIIMARLYGGKEYGKLKREFASTFLFGIIFSMAVFITGFILADKILIWINTPAEILKEASLYLRIMFVGFLFTFQYNIMSHSLRGIGNSSMPVVFLGISCGLNILMDLLFIAVFKMGVMGAGLATVIAEAISVGACMLYIYGRVDLLKLTTKDMHIDRPLLKQTLALGSVTALQQAAQPVGKIFIQSAINAQGVITIGAFNAVCRVDDFACIPAQSIGSGIMTCTAQNRGAGDKNRVKAAISKGLLVALCYFPIIFTLVMLLKGPLMVFLTPPGSSEMIAMGVEYLSVKAWIFVLACIVNAIQGFARGVGKMHISLISTILQIGIRAILVFLFVPRFGIVAEAYACAIGWIIQAVYEYGYFIVTRKKLEMSIGKQGN